MKKSVECAHSAVPFCLCVFDTKASRMFSYLSLMISKSNHAFDFLL